MTKFDVEDLLDGILQIMTDYLNTQIAAVEADKVAKGKGITGGLTSIATGSYYRQNWTDKIFNTAPSIFYGIEDTNTVSMQGVAAVTYKVFVEAIMIDSGNDNFGVSRSFRYARALKEIFEEKFAQFSDMGRIKIETIQPVSFKLDSNTSEEAKVSGVSLTVTIV